MAKPDPKLQIRKLPYRIHLELSRLLDIPGEKDWRSLIAVLPDGMYTTNQVSISMESCLTSFIIHYIISDKFARLESLYFAHAS